MRVKSKLLSVSLSLALMTCLYPGLAFADSVESSDESIDAIALDAENNQESSELDKMTAQLRRWPPPQQALSWVKHIRDV